MIKLLLEYKNELSINIDEQAGSENRAAIHYAALKGHRELFKFLIQQGADENLKDKSGVIAGEAFEKMQSEASGNVSLQ